MQRSTRHVSRWTPVALALSGALLLGVTLDASAQLRAAPGLVVGPEVGGASGTVVADPASAVAVPVAGASDAPGAPGAVPNAPGPVLAEPRACDARKLRTVSWTPRISAVLSDRVRDDLWSESNLHGYLGPCDTLTLLPGLDQIQAAMEDPSHLDQLQCLWDLGLMGEARRMPVRDSTGRTVPVSTEDRQAVLTECQATAITHQDGYLHDQVRALGAEGVTP